MIPSAGMAGSTRPPLVTPAFLLIGLATLAYFIADGILLPTVPTFVKGPLGGDDLTVGLVAGAFSVTALLLRPFSGRLADRAGRRFVMLLGAGAFGVSVLGYLVADSPLVLIVFRLLTGVGEALFFVGSLAAATDLAPEERRGEAFSLITLGLYAGIGIGPQIGEAMVRISGYDAAWWSAAAAAAIAILLASFVRVPKPVIEEDAPRVRLIHPAAMLPGLVILTSVAGMAGFFAFTPLYTDRTLHIGGAGGVLLLLSVVVIGIRLIGRRLPDVLGPRTASRWALALSAIGFGVMAAWQTPIGLYAGTFVFAVGIALATPALGALALAGLKPAERGAAVATFTAFIDIAFGVGPAALGFVAGAAGYPAVYAVGALIAVAGFALLFTRRVVKRTAR